MHPFPAVHCEYSLWRRELGDDLLPTLREPGIARVPWSPLGGGLLTGTVATLDEDDFRNHNPRYQDANFAASKARFALLAVQDKGPINPQPITKGGSWR